jgi:hypothetical protein
MNIKETKVYTFNFTPDGMSFDFKIEATTEQEAAEKLHKGVAFILTELSSMVNLNKPKKS